jgi:hypothetical protein
MYDVEDYRKIKKNVGRDVGLVGLSASAYA